MSTRPTAPRHGSSAPGALRAAPTRPEGAPGPPATKTRPRLESRGFARGGGARGGSAGLRRGLRLPLRRELLEAELLLELLQRPEADHALRLVARPEERDRR